MARREHRAVLQRWSVAMTGLTVLVLLAFSMHIVFGTHLTAVMGKP